MSSPTAQNKYLSRSYIDGVYIPSGLLVVGCLIVKREWVPYAILLALALGGYKVWNNSTYNALRHIAKDAFGAMAKLFLGVQAVLKPTVFQDFELKEKTIISHNVAMSVQTPCL